MNVNVNIAGKSQLWLQTKRPSLLCPRIQYSSKKKTTTTTRCFIDDHEVDKHNRYGFSVYPHLIAVSPSLPWALTKEYGSSGVLTIERPKMDMSLKSPSKSVTGRPSLDDGGDSKDGGDDGGIGGGNGGDGGGVNDDDQYRFNDDYDDDDQGGFALFGIRVLVLETFDRISMNAVLSEWKQTMKDLPKGLQRACEMGLLSTAEMTKLFWFNTRPTLVRLFVHLLPQRLSVDFYVKVMADPALPWKLFWEAASSVGWSVWLDFENDKEREISNWNAKIKREWHLVLANALTNAFLNSFVVFSLAPSSALSCLRKLPNNVFEKSHRFREFDMQKRVVSFFSKAVSLFALGFAMKAAAQIRLLASTEHDGQLEKKMSIGTFATLSKQALGAGLSLALLTNLRHQLIWGIDRRLDRHFDVTNVSLVFCLALRFLNVGIGTRSHKYWVGSDHQEMDSWLVSRNRILTGSGVGDTSNKTKRAAKRKRVIKKK